MALILNYQNLNFLFIYCSKLNLMLFLFFRLSERNCIEIVKKLIGLKLIDVIFTNDGKEYLTPQRLLKEIKDELIVHGGLIISFI